MTSFKPGPDTRRLFRDALGTFGTGVTIVTTRGPDGPCGITANSFASVSLDPPLVLWSVDVGSDRARIFCDATHSAIHVLGAHQSDTARHFAKSGHRFEGLDWSEGETNVPLLHGALCRFDCETVAVHDGGDHKILVSKVLHTTLAPGEPLLFHGGRFGRIHHHD
ncbi:flavin reductase family protein [Pseudoruegeria sp. SK021]|uniref:flavin reductase family protein n=1 Tax=Pseudoruegeria sp. SK021 TaxID=1933035 RepID=UPI000A227B1B|nr:flavin reductase family protein [Pseudoruegeria sp. SK021]OSP56406.1 flavin oxidoreductase [Pseudoruegeria sp. SK021]